MTEKLPIAERVRRVLGDLGYWEKWLLISLVFAALAAVAVAFTTLKSLGEAGERIAELNRQTEQLRKDTADANARANEAALALEKLKSPRQMSEEQISAVAAAVSAFKGTRFDMSLVAPGPEPGSVLILIARSVRTAGWEWIEWNHPDGPFMNIFKFPDTPNIGQGGGQWTGIGVLYHPDHASEFAAAANALAEALTKSGLLAHAGPTITDDIPNHDTIHIVVGVKPVQ